MLPVTPLTVANGSSYTAIPKKINFIRPELNGEFREPGDLRKTFAHWGSEDHSKAYPSRLSGVKKTLTDHRGVVDYGPES